MSKTVGSDEVYRMPWEGADTTPSAAGESLFDLLGPESDEDAGTTEDAGGSVAEGDDPDAGTDDEASDDEGDGPVEDDEASDESDDEGDDDGKNDEGDDDPTPQTFKVKVDGAEVEVPLDELLKGYSRTADYTRKTQALADERKSFEAEAAQTRETRDAYAQLVEQLSELLEGTAEPNVDWDKLRQENPAEYAALRADVQQREQQRAAVKAERERLRQEKADEAEAAFKVRVAEEREKLRAAIPEWADPKVAAAEKKALADYAKSAFGVSDEELAGIADHRMMILLRKAHRYDQLQKTGKKQLEQKKKGARVLTPGSREQDPKGRRARTETRKRLDRLAKTGSVRDAAAAFEGFLDD